MTRLPSDNCRHCGRLPVDGHRPFCVHAAAEPLRTDPPFDLAACGRAEDRYVNALIGEWPR